MQENIQFNQYVSDLYQKFTSHDAQHTDRLKRYRNIETESAELLSMLVKTQQTKQLLEIGTSTGYSTLWLAKALSQTQGQMTTLEIDTERSEQAKHHAQNLGLDHLIHFQVFDFILLDAERDAYLEYWNYLPQILNQKKVF